MGRNYLMAYKLIEGKENESFNEAFEWLITAKESPWVKYRWDLSLKREKANDL